MTIIGIHQLQAGIYSIRVVNAIVGSISVYIGASFSSTVKKRIASYSDKVTAREGPELGPPPIKPRVGLGSCCGEPKKTSKIASP